MNSQEKYSEDLLRRYIKPERIGKAPEGFTEEVMTRVQSEILQLKASNSSRGRNLVPVISIIVTLVLITSAFLVPVSGTNSSVLPVFKFINSIHITVPEINLSSILRLTLPSVIIYTFIGILVLTILDRALNGIFHREK